MSFHKDQAIKAEEKDLPECITLKPVYFNDGQILTDFTAVVDFPRYTCEHMSILRRQQYHRAQS